MIKVEARAQREAGSAGVVDLYSSVAEKVLEPVNVNVSVGSFLFVVGVRYRVTHLILSPSFDSLSFEMLEHGYSGSCALLTSRGLATIHGSEQGSSKKKTFTGIE